MMRTDLMICLAISYMIGAGGRLATMVQRNENRKYSSPGVNEFQFYKTKRLSALYVVL